MTSRRSLFSMIAAGAATFIARKSSAAPQTKMENRSYFFVHQHVGYEDGIYPYRLRGICDTRKEALVIAQSIDPRFEDDGHPWGNVKSKGTVSLYERDLFAAHGFLRGISLWTIQIDHLSAHSVLGKIADIIAEADRYALQNPITFCLDTDENGRLYHRENFVRPPLTTPYLFNYPIPGRFGHVPG